jgi:hypothetical protein
LNDDSRIRELKRRLGNAGWEVGGPEANADGTFWRAGGMRMDGALIGVGPAGGGSTPVAAVEDLYAQILGDLPMRPIGHGFDVPEEDAEEFESIRALFHSQLYEFRVFHPRSDTWHAQWNPHGETERIGALPPCHESALKTAQLALATFQAQRRESGA